MTAINTMVKRVAGLTDTRDVSDWENEFIKNIVARTNNGDNTSMLTERQIERLEEIFDKHFSRN
ncbi:MAG: hypothetical protein QM749_00435 [Aquabacterium sp.]